MLRCCSRLMDGEVGVGHVGQVEEVRVVGRGQLYVQCGGCWTRAGCGWAGGESDVDELGVGVFGGVSEREREGVVVEGVRLARCGHHGLWAARSSS